jgi:hypothetical protein
MLADNAENGETDSDKITSDLSRLRAACERDLGDPAEWPTPPGYPNSLALCIIDAIYSTGARHNTVEKVIDRYRQHRRAQGGDPDRDGAVELLRTVEEAGGPDPWASQIGNRRPTSPAPNAPLKSTAVAHAAKSLVTLGITTTTDLRDVSEAGRLEPARSAWCEIAGQRSGVTWNNLMKLAQLPAESAGRLVVAYVVRELGATSAERVAELVREVADAAGWDARRLDHAIWRFESGQQPGRMTAAKKLAVSETESR